MEGDKALAGCVQLLRGASDEEKFAGLLLVTKVVKGDDRAALATVLDALGASFVVRLLNTAQEGQGVSYQAIALNVLSAFRALAPTDVLHAFVPHVRTVLMVAHAAARVGVVRDAMVVADMLSAHGDAFAAVCSDAVADVAAQLCVRCCEASADDTHVWAATPADRTALDEATGAAIALLSRVVVAHASHGTVGVGAAVPSLCRMLHTTHSHACFASLHALVSLFALHAPTRAAAAARGGVVWGGALREALQRMLSSKLRDEDRDAALTLVQMMWGVAGHAWMVNEGADSGADMFRLLTIVVQLVKVEVRVLGDEAEEPSPRVLRMLFVCYQILELLIDFLVRQDEEDSHGMPVVPLFPLDMLKKVAQALRDTFNVILSITVDLHVHDSALVVASMRTLGRWLAEDNMSLRDEVCRGLERVLTVAETHRSADVEPLAFLLPTFVHWAEDVDLFVRHFLRGHGHVRVAEMLARMSSAYCTDAHAGARVEGSIVMGAEVLRVVLRRGGKHIPRDTLHACLASALPAVWCAVHQLSAQPAALGPGDVCTQHVASLLYFLLAVRAKWVHEEAWPHDAALVTYAVQWALHVMGSEDEAVDKEPLEGLCVSVVQTATALQKGCALRVDVDGGRECVGRIAMLRGGKLMGTLEMWMGVNFQ